MRPKMKEAIVKCPKCGSSDTVSLTYHKQYGAVSIERPAVTWCECGVITVTVEQGMEVLVKRG